MEEQSLLFEMVAARKTLQDMSISRAVVHTVLGKSISVVCPQTF